MANTIMPTVFASGVRRVRATGMAGMPSLAGWASVLGTAPDVSAIADLENAGYDPGLVKSAIAMGATNEQLQALPFPADPVTRGDAIANLLAQLGGGLPSTGAPASAAGSYPQSAIPSQVSYGFQVYDLAQKESWDAIAGLFTETQQRLNDLARSAPNDQEIIGKVGEFNSLVGQFASYYQQVFGSAPSPLPFASFPTLSGLGIAPLVIGAAVVAALAVVLASLYTINNWIDLKKEQIRTSPVDKNQQNVGGLTDQGNKLLQQANAAYAANNKALGDSLMAQYNQVLDTIRKIGTAPQGGVAVDFATWFQRNWGWLMLGLGAIIIVPPALRRR